MIQQRQYFARRREQNQQNARRAEVRQNIDSFRHPHRGTENAVEGTNGEQMPPVSIDFLPLANPSAIDSLLSELRRPKRPRLHGPRQGRREVPGGVRRELAQDLPAQDLDLDVSNDIRVFDADVEKTHQYRRRILPQGFLNSQVTADERRRGGRRVRGHFRGALAGRRSWHDRKRRVVEPGIAHREHDASFPQLRRDEVVDMGKASWTTPTNFDHASRREAGSPRRQGRKIPSSRFRSPTSSPLDGRAVTRQFEDDEIVEGTPSSDGKRNAYQKFLFGVSPNIPEELKTRVPTAQKLLFTLNEISPRFPPVTVNSDSSSSLARYRPVKKEEKEPFQSLLSKEDMTNDQFSAILQELEGKLLDLPDRDVPFMTMSTRALNRQTPLDGLHRTASSGDSKLQHMSNTVKGTSNPTFVTDASRVKANPCLPDLPKPERAAMLRKDVTMSSEGKMQLDVDNAPKSRSGLLTGMEVSFGSGARNPISTAADGAVSEMAVRELQ